MENVKAAISSLQHFIGRKQLVVMATSCNGEEGDFFRKMLVELAATIDKMPKIGETDGQGDNAIVHLHYFRGAADYHVIEKDLTPEQIQAFGMCDLGMGFPELGYVPIQELLRYDFELDLYWQPITLQAVKASR